MTDPAATSQFELIEYFQQFAEREKTAFARDLHDELGGLLIAAVMDLETLRPLIGNLPADSQSRFARAQRALQSAIDLSRRMTEQLRPTLLDNVGLFAAMRWQLRDVCEKSEVHCIEELPSVEPRLSSQTGITLYRIAQEAILIGLQRERVTELTLRGECIEQRYYSHRVRGWRSVAGRTVGTRQHRLGIHAPSRPFHGWGCQRAIAGRSRHSLDHHDAAAGGLKGNQAGILARLPAFVAQVNGFPGNRGDQYGNVGAGIHPVAQEQAVHRETHGCGHLADE